MRIFNVIKEDWQQVSTSIFLRGIKKDPQLVCTIKGGIRQTDSSNETE
jgi:hypothetical protein